MGGREGLGAGRPRRGVEALVVRLDRREGEVIVPARSSVLVAGGPRGCPREDKAGLIALVVRERASAWAAARTSALVVLVAGARCW